eukprot:scaffold64626_cov64-Phaeocystis_antarctica.AAC.1
MPAHTGSHSPLPIQHCQLHFTARLRCTSCTTPAAHLMLSRTANLLERMASGYLKYMHHGAAHRADLPNRTWPRSSVLCREELS